MKTTILSVLTVLCFEGASAQGLGVGVAAPAGQLDVLGVAGRPSGLFNDNGVDADFRVEGAGDANLLMLDASVDRAGIGVAAPQAKLDIVNLANADVVLSVQGTAAQSGDFFEIQNSAGSDLITVSANAGALGGVVINEQQQDADVRIEGDNTTDLFHTDASVDRVGIGVAAPQARLDVVGSVNADVVSSIQGTAAQSGDFFEIQNSAGADLITVSANAGALGGVVINEQGSDADVRIESNDVTEMFFVDAGNNRIGVGGVAPAVTFTASAPQEELDVRGTMIGALPLISVSCMRQKSPDADQNDDDAVCIMAASVPSTGHVWVRVTDNTNRNIEDHDTEGNWDAWVDFGDPCGGCGAGYIIDLSMTIVRGDDTDNDEWGALMMVRWTSGAVYERNSDDADYNITDLDNTGNWEGWAAHAGPGM